MTNTKPPAQQPTADALARATQAIHDLADTNCRLSVHAVRARAGVSLGAAMQALRDWRATERDADQAIPAELLGRFTAIWNAALTAAADDYSTDRAAAAKELAEIAAEIQRLEADNATLTRENQKLEGITKGAKADSRAANEWAKEREAAALVRVEQAESYSRDTRAERDAALARATQAEKMLESVLKKLTAQ